MGMPALAELLPASAGHLHDDVPQRRCIRCWPTNRAYLHPYRWTSLGLSLIEAMTIGMPVLALPVTAAPEVGARRTPGCSAPIPTCSPPPPGGGWPTPTRRRSAGRSRAGRMRCATFGLAPFPDRLAARLEGGGRMKIAMVSEHASPLAALGGVDAGGQNVHVAALALGLAARGHGSGLHPPGRGGSRRSGWSLGPASEVVHVPGRSGRAHRKGRPAAVHGRIRPLDGRAPGCRTALRTWCTPISGCPGIAALEAADAVAVPLVHTFHALGTVKRRHQHDRDTSPAERSRRRAQIGRSVDRMIATCTDEVEELRRMGVPADAVRVVPCGVDTTLFSPRARTGTTGAGRVRPGGCSASGGWWNARASTPSSRRWPTLPGVRLLIAGGPEKSPAGHRSRGPTAGRAGRRTRRHGPRRAARQRRARADAGPDPGSRPGRLHALVRTVRHRADRGRGLRHAPSSAPRSAVCWTPSSTAGPARSSHREIPPPPRGPSAICSPIPTGAPGTAVRPAGARSRSTTGPRYRAATDRVYRSVVAARSALTEVSA